MKKWFKGTDRDPGNPPARQDPPNVVTFEPAPWSSDPGSEERPKRSRRPASTTPPPSDVDTRIFDLPDRSITQAQARPVLDRPDVVDPNAVVEDVVSAPRDMSSPTIRIRRWVERVRINIWAWLFEWFVVTPLTFWAIFPIWRERYRKSIKAVELEASVTAHTIAFAVESSPRAAERRDEALDRVSRHRARVRFHTFFTGPALFVEAALAVHLFAPWWIEAPVAYVVAWTLGMVARDFEEAKERNERRTAKHALTSDRTVGAVRSVGLEVESFEIAPHRTREGDYLCEFHLAAGQSVTKLVAKLEAFSSGLRVPQEFIEIENPSHDEVPGTHAGYVRLRIRKTSATEAMVDTPFLDDRSRIEPYPMISPGVDRQGRPFEMLMVGVTVIVAGRPGLGKSSIVKLLLAVLAHCVEAEIHIADLKGGADFTSIGRRLCHWFLDEPSSQQAMADTATRHIVTIRDRAQQRHSMCRTLSDVQLEDNSAPKLVVDGRPTEEAAEDPELDFGPLVLVVDEPANFKFASDGGVEAREALGDLAATARSANVTVIIVGQEFGQKILPARVLNNSAFRITLGTSSTQNTFLNGDNAHSAGIRSDLLTLPGQFFLVGKGITGGLRMTAYNADDETVASLVDTAFKLRSECGRLSDNGPGMSGLSDSGLPGRPVIPAGHVVSDLPVLSDGLSDLSDSLVEAVSVLYRTWPVDESTSEPVDYLTNEQVARLLSDAKTFGPVLKGKQLANLMKGSELIGSDHPTRGALVGPGRVKGILFTELRASVVRLVPDLVTATSDIPSHRDAGSEPVTDPSHRDSDSGLVGDLSHRDLDSGLVPVTEREDESQ